MCLLRVTEKEEDVMDKKIAWVDGVNSFVEMPINYDPAKVTEEDLRYDAGLCLTSASEKYLVHWWWERYGTWQPLKGSEERATFTTREDAVAAIDAMSELHDDWADCKYRITAVTASGTSAELFL